MLYSFLPPPSEHVCSSLSSIGCPFQSCKSFLSAFLAATSGCHYMRCLGFVGKRRPQWRNRYSMTRLSPGHRSHASIIALSHASSVVSTANYCLTKFCFECISFLPSAVFEETILIFKALGCDTWTLLVRRHQVASFASISNNLKYTAQGLHTLNLRFLARSIHRI